MKFVKSVAVLAAAILAVQYLPGFVKEHVVDAQTSGEEAEVVDALITGYETSEDDPSAIKVITSDTLSKATPDANNLIHDSRFDDYVKQNVIDISKYQGNIDWNAVASDNITGAVVRAGYRGYGGGIIVKDYKFDDNMKGALNAGLDVGVYFFTQAINEKEAIEEANLVISMLKGYNVSLPVYFDIEDTAEPGRLNNAKLTIAQRTAIVEAFCQTVENAGYRAGVYASKSYYLDKLDPDYLSQKYEMWLAHYTTKTTYKGDYHMWQYSDAGTVKGISGRVDMDVLYSKKAKFASDSVTITDTETPVKPEVSGDGVLTFASSDPSVATIDAEGNISGVANGTAVMTVSSTNGSVDTMTVNVELPPYAVLNYTGMVFSEIGSKQVVSRAAGVTLTSSDSNVVSVSDDGTAVAVGCGTASITANDGNGNTAVCNVLVANSQPETGDCNGDGIVNAIDAVYILNLSATLGLDDTEQQLSADYKNVYDFNGDGKIDSFDASDVLMSSASAGVNGTSK